MYERWTDGFYTLGMVVRSETPFGKLLLAAAASGTVGPSGNQAARARTRARARGVEDNGSAAVKGAAPRQHLRT